MWILKTWDWHYSAPKNEPQDSFANKPQSVSFKKKIPLLSWKLSSKCLIKEDPLEEITEMKFLVGAHQPPHVYPAERKCKSKTSVSPHSSQAYKIRETKFVLPIDFEFLSSENWSSS